MQYSLTEHKFSSRILFLMEQIIEQNSVCIGYYCADFVTNIYCLMCSFIHTTVKKIP